MNPQEETVRNYHCQFFLVRKKRFCRMVVKENHQFCGEHEPASNEELPKSRVVCPLDNSHTCYAHKLKRHLKICNARTDEMPPYIQYGVNNEEDHCDLPSEENNKRNLKNVNADDLTVLIAKVEKIFSDIGQVILESDESHKVLAEEIIKSEYGNDARRHLQQTSALLGLLEKYGLVKPNSCFVEFGGGKGKLSFWLSEATKNVSDTMVLLVDKASHRHKQDNKCREHVIRIKADIRDLILKNVDVISESESVVGVAKHLCGAATDLALKCMESLENMRGLVFAFCCHHRCEWGSYKGKEYLGEVGLSREDFDVMCGLVSWATCGHAEKKKVEIGKKCKMILDWGRLLYLRKRGFECVLHRYVPSELSLENICIVAYKR